MLGETITLNVGTASEPSNITLNRVNNDNYSSEYRLKETDREHLVLVRHSTEKNKVKGRTLDRHNVTYTVRYFPTDIYPQGRELQVYSIIRNARDDMNEDITPLVNAVSEFTLEFADRIINWES